MPIAVSYIELGKEVITCYKEIVLQIKEVKTLAGDLEIEPETLRDTEGNYVLGPLLAAKAQMLHSLALINQKGG